jgi:hypothetical protein
MRNLRTLRTTCQQRLAGITVPQPFDLDTFAGEIARRRRRPLEIRDLPGAARGTLTGAWVATDTADYVFLEPAASTWHRNVIALHEFAHMLCDHVPARWGRDLAGMLAPGISSDLIRQMLGRHGYSNDQECEAEMTAWLICAHADTGPEAAIAAGGDPLPRLSEALRHPLRHV